MTGTLSWSGVDRRAGLVPLALTLAAALLAAGCSDDDPVKPATVPPPPPPSLITAPSTGPVATIRRTTGNVPHITATTLESAAFGLGYAQAQDNVCLLAEAFVRARSERARYFGPGPGSVHVFNDFSYKAMHIQATAATDYAAMSEESRALVRGFTAGYNKYLRDTPPASFPAECRSQPWVFQVTPEDLVAHLLIVAQLGSGDVFSDGAVFAAVPPGVDVTPAPPGASKTTVAKLRPVTDLGAAARGLADTRTRFKESRLASNAWGIGSGLTENGRGVLLANPHFPYTGSLRLYESQLTVPGYMNFHGAGLIGVPIPLIGFNQNLGWSHTVSTGRRFTMYELQLKPGDNLTYIKDGQERPITSETIQIWANVGLPAPVPLQRKFYRSEYGPMLPGDLMTGGALPAWGAAGTAYTYRDANASSVAMLDTWVGFGRATTLAEFQEVLKSCSNTLWVNSTYADDKGNAYYIDSSSVPNLSAEAIGVLKAKIAGSPAYAALFGAGLTLLDGRTSRDDWVEGNCNGHVPFDRQPQLTRTDFVQNSNDSYWSTNPASFLEGYSPLIGPERSALGPRTRIGLYMLQNPTNPGFAAVAPAGQDGKFGADDIARVLHNNRTWYAEQFLAELRSRCTAIGAGTVNLPGGGTRQVDTACAVLAAWNGVYDVDSVGAHVFRVFINDYRSKFSTDLTVPFNPADPVGTPSTPRPMDPANLANDPMLQSLAAGLDRLDLAAIPYTATLGSVQFVQPSGGVPPGGVPTLLGPSFPWHGGDGSLDGAFNAVATVDSDVQQKTRLPRINPVTIDGTGGLSATPGEGWLIAYGTSWHFGLEFTASGPRAVGLVSYSQSTNSESPFFNDQQLRYSQKNMRPILFTEADIAANQLPGSPVTIRP